MELHKALLAQARSMLRAILTSEREARLRIERGKGRDWTRSAAEEVAGKVSSPLTEFHGYGES
jgi:hypothetical protein